MDITLMIVLPPCLFSDTACHGCSGKGHIKTACPTASPHLKGGGGKGYGGYGGGGKGYGGGGKGYGGGGKGYGGGGKGCGGKGFGGRGQGFDGKGKGKGGGKGGLYENPQAPGTKVGTSQRHGTTNWTMRAHT